MGIVIVHSLILAGDKLPGHVQRMLEHSIGENKMQAI